MKNIIFYDEKIFFNFFAHFIKKNVDLYKKIGIYGFC